MSSIRAMSRFMEVLDSRKAWIIFLVAFLLYLPSVAYDFTQDDAIVIYQNEYVKQGFQGLGDIFSTDTFSGFFGGEQKSNLVSGGRYRPLTLGLFAIVYEFFGSTPWVYHFISIISYSLLCLLLFRAVKRSFGEVDGSYAEQLAFVAAMIFVVHPIHTEVVANVKGLDEIWSLLLAASAYLCVLRYIKSSNAAALLGGGSLFFLALLAKESAAPMLLLIPLLSFFSNYSKQGVYGSVMRTGGVFFLVFLIYYVLRSQIVGQGLTDPPMEMMNNPFIKVVEGSYLPFTSEEKWATIVFGLGKYIQLLFFPHPLSHDYYPRHIDVMTFDDAPVILSSVMLICLIGIALTGIKKRSLSSLMILFFFATILLTSNILFPIGTHLSERFLFTPSCSFAVLGGMLYMHVHRSRKTLALVLISLVMGAFSLKTIVRSAVWKDNLTLFTTDAMTARHSAKVQNAAGGILLDAALEENERNPDPTTVRKAISHLESAIAIHPRYKEPTFLLANAYSYTKQYDASIRSYDRVLELDPSHRQAYDNLLIVLKQAARYAGGEQRDAIRAMAYLNRILDMNPSDFDALSLMGTAFGSQGQHNEAVTYYQRAISVNPDIALTYVNLGLAQLNLGMSDEAQLNFQKAKDIDPRALDKIR